MKTLTVWNPWSQLLADGRKKTETRSWPTNHRGPLAIHAAARNLDRDFARECGYDPDALACGAIIAVVELTSCHRMTAEWIATVSAKERSFGFYEPGRYAWHVKLIEALREPIPARGYQMLWNFELKKLARGYSLFAEA